MKALTKTKKKGASTNSPDPTIPTNIWITFPVCSKAWTLTTSTLTFSTMTASKSVLATLRTSRGVSKG